MLKLINIKVNDDMIEADYIPEDSSRSAHVYIDRNDFFTHADIIEQYGKTYGNMAIAGLKDILNKITNGKTTVPKEKTVMWY